MVGELQPEDPRSVGPYGLLGRLGAGGMGQVFLGRSRGGRLVAVKVIRPELAGEPGFRARFAREVAAARNVGGLFTALVVDDDAHRTSPPVREILLETLADFRWPQNAGFLEEYLLAKYQLHVDSRAFAPLRRDERNAGDRAPGARESHIAPALKPDGSANPRWITRSDWDIERRIVATRRTERDG